MSAAKPFPVRSATARILAANGETKTWKQLLQATEKGLPRALLANCLIALRQSPEWANALRFNQFNLEVVLAKPTPWGTTAGSQWTDHQDRLATEWFQNQGIHVGIDIAAAAVQTVAEEHPFHPLRDWFDELKWDGVPRIATWLSDYLGVENSQYSRAVGRRWLISAVARIYKPAAKVDCALILEGPQGRKKSTALKVLGGKHFTDELADIGSKDAALQLVGVSIVELAELDNLNRSDTARIKAFMTRTTDRFRPPYGRRIAEFPRQCVFAGSVNHSTYLRDETGGRRFWPVACGAILIDNLIRDRDQLWAEAVAAFKAGDSWWLDTPELEKAAAIEQEDRREVDPWEEVISRWAADYPEITVDQVLRNAIGKTAEKTLQVDQNRVSKCLKALHWKQVRARDGENRCRVWRRDD